MSRRLKRYSLLPILLVGLATFAVRDVASQSLPVGDMPLSATTVDLIGEDAASIINDTLPADIPMEWQVYVPPNYRPERPSGVLVFINSNNWGGIPDNWRPVMEARNLIWISANGDGAGAPLERQRLKAILAPRAIDRNYAIDTSRIYLAGVDGGARVATLIEASNPETFMGAVYIGRAAPWNMDPVKVEKIRTNRHVFISSGTGPSAREVKQVYDAYKNAGIENAVHFRVSKMGREGPDERRLMQAIDYLDARGQQ